MTTTTHKASSPVPKLLLGSALIIFWLMATLLQIQTSEAFILQGPKVTFMPNWSVFMQPFDLVQGHLSPDMAKSVMWGWGMELAFLICIVGFEVAHESVKASSKRFAAWFQTGLFILIAFDAYTDFNYGSLASGFWGQIAFAGVTVFVVMFFGTVGLRFMEQGFADWSK